MEPSLAAGRSDSVLIFGASARAAAFSALRAGLQPWCADLFADADLRARCPVTRLPAQQYPDAFLQVAAELPPGPWLYAGGLENRFALIDRLARLRTLWGNGTEALRLARSPEHIAALLARAGLPFLQVRMAQEMPPGGGTWLCKPLHGAGGAGIRITTMRTRTGRGANYYQEFIEGESCSAVFVADGRAARFAGATLQLVGEDWLNARSFQYCGSIGPLSLPGMQGMFATIGNCLARGCGLRGLFGVDCILNQGRPYPVEINPRYTASVEVLEHALGWKALAEHRSIFEPAASRPPLGQSQGSCNGNCIGKAILFAKAALDFPPAGPWLATLRNPASVNELSDFADIPQAGERIERGRPILTFFARGATPVSCREALQAMATDLDRWLYER
jgi:predicted ATP-grasp superfamily ATP-dependent carboligase